MKFDKFSENCVVILYPSGGYGNFLYHILTEYLDNTVKIVKPFNFDKSGNSHAVKKYVRIFEPSIYFKRTKDYSKYDYGYDVWEESFFDQLDKKFLVLADVGYMWTNHRKIKNYFPNAKIIRVFAPTLMEKFTVVYNVMIKNAEDMGWDLYKNTFVQNKENMTDLQAVQIMDRHFKTDFKPLSVAFSKPLVEDDFYNLQVNNFFKKDTILYQMDNIANFLNCKIIQKDRLEQIIDDFLTVQSVLRYTDASLLDDDLISQVIKMNSDKFYNDN